MHQRTVVPALVTLLACLMSQAAFGAKFYRWVDEQGETHYGASVPPEYLQKQHRELSNQGVTTRRHQRTKTPEELAEERLRLMMRGEEQKRIRAQEADDLILLQTYSSLDDMELARDGKIAAIEAVIRITKSNIGGMRSTLSQMTEQAADHERAGRTVPPKLDAQIKDVQRQIEESLAFINHQREEQAQVRQEFEREMARYARLRSVREKRELDAAVISARTQQRSLLGDAARGGTLICKDAVSCDKAWTLAEAYVQQHAGAPVQLTTATLIMTYEPGRGDELGMYVARYPESGGGARIVMETVCEGTPAGANFCKSDAVLSTRAGFRPYLEAGL